MNGRGFFQAFQVPGYRWILLSTIAWSAAFIAESMTHGWLILELTDSPFWLGVAVGVGGICEFSFSIFAGVLADRFNRRKLQMTVLALGGLGAGTMALLILTGNVTLWLALGLIALTGIAAGVNTPTRMALTTDVMGASRLLNANAFTGIALGTTGMLGASMGGIVIDNLGLGQSFALVAGSYVIAVAFLVLLKSPPRMAVTNEPPLKAMRDGLRYAVRTPLVRRILTLSIITEGLGTPAIYLLPVVSRDILHVGATGNGYLMAMVFAGMISAGLIVAALGDFQKKGWLLLGGALGFSGFLFAFGFSQWFLLSLALMYVVGVTGGVYDASMSTILQTSVPSSVRGRVLGLYSATWGVNKLGGFGLGAIATILSVPAAIAIGSSLAAGNAVRLIPGVGSLHGKPRDNAQEEEKEAQFPSTPTVS